MPPLRTRAHTLFIEADDVKWILTTQVLCKFLNNDLIYLRKRNTRAFTQAHNPFVGLHFY
jgi:hypothetical protein